MQLSNVSSTGHKYQAVENRKNLKDNSHSNVADTNAVSIFLGLTMPQEDEDKLSNVNGKESERSLYERYSDMVKASNNKEDYSNVKEGTVASLSSGVSFYYYEDTEEIRCVDDMNPAEGRQTLWSKKLSKEEYQKCDEIFYKYRNGGKWEYKYEAYLQYESFWDMFLYGQFDVETYKKEHNL